MHAALIFVQLFVFWMIDHFVVVVVDADHQNMIGFDYLYVGAYYAKVRCL